MHSRKQWQPLKPWLNELWSSPRRLSVGFILMLLTALTGIGLLAVSGWFITAAAVLTVAFNIFVPGAAIRAFALIRTVARYAERLYHHDFILRMQQRWRLKLFARFCKLPLMVTESLATATVLQRLTQDLNALDDLYLRVIAPFASALIVSLLLVVLTWLWLPAAAVWVALLMMAILGGLCFRLTPQVNAVTGSELVQQERVRKQALALLEGAAELHAWQRFESASEHLKARSEALLAIQRIIERRRANWQAGLEVTLQCMLLGTLLLALMQGAQGHLSGPMVMLLALAVLGLTDYLTSLLPAALLWGKVRQAAKSLNQFSALAKPSHPQQVASPADEDVNMPAFSLRQALPQGREGNTQAPVTLDMQAKQRLLLQGPSGAGKTTLAYMLAGILPLASGTRRCAGRVSLLTQYNSVLNGPLADNLRMADEHISEDAMWQVLRAVALAHEVAQMPQQLNTWLGPGGWELSGGQARRLCLARALLKPAELLILDEPFTGVGNAQAVAIADAIEPWLAGKAVLILSHENAFKSSVPVLNYATIRAL